MPKYLNIQCSVCGKNDRKPWVKNPPKYCSRKCWKRAEELKIETRIGEPLEDALRRLYIDERKSYRQICKILKINQRTVMRKMRKFNIEIRHGGDAIKTQWENNDARRKAQTEFFRRVGYSIKGEKHPSWKGGISNTQASHYTTQAWMRHSEYIRQRDNYKCTKCNMTNQEHINAFGASLHVHHIVPLVLSNDDSENNLRTVCIKCHRRLDKEFPWVL